MSNQHQHGHTSRRRSIERRRYAKLPNLTRADRHTWRDVLRTAVTLSELPTDLPYTDDDDDVGCDSDASDRQTHQDGA